MAEEIITAFQQINWVEALAVIFGILYVILAAYENNWCWLAAAISVSLYIYICLTYQLYAETGLQVFYLAMAYYGWRQWKTAGSENESILDLTQVQSKTPILLWDKKIHIISIIAGSFASMFLGYLLAKNTNASLPYLDSAITVFSILATFMVTRKVLENWLYWIVIDSLAIYVYLNRDLYFTAVLYFIYVIIAVAGYIRWKKEFSQQTT